MTIHQHVGIACGYYGLVDVAALGAQYNTSVLE